MILLISLIFLAATVFGGCFFLFCMALLVKQALFLFSLGIPSHRALSVVLVAHRLLQTPLSLKLSNALTRILDHIRIEGVTFVRILLAGSVEFRVSH